MKFAIFNNDVHLAFGKLVHADSIDHLLEQKISKKDRQTWELIKYRDENDLVMCITREFMDEGMTLDEVIEDWRLYGQKEFGNEDIACFPIRYTANPEPIYI